MQCALMERVLETLLEVENLTLNEKTWVQDGLAFIRSDVTESSSTSARLTKVIPYVEAFSDLSTLISIRYAHQSEEEENSVRIARAWTGSSDRESNEGGPHHDSEKDGNRIHPHRPPADAPHDSQRRHLAKEINAIIKASTEVSTGESTLAGLNRRARWNTDKLAGGSEPTLQAGGRVTATGNTANAQMAARKSAQDVRDSPLQSS